MRVESCVWFPVDKFETLLAEFIIEFLESFDCSAEGFEDLGDAVHAVFFESSSQSEPFQTGCQRLDNVLVCDDCAKDGEVRATTCNDEGWTTTLVTDLYQLLDVSTPNHST